MLMMMMIRIMVQCIALNEGKSPIFTSFGVNPFLRVEGVMKGITLSFQVSSFSTE